MYSVVQSKLFVTMPLLSVKVTQGFKTLLPFAIVNISDTSSLYDIFEGLCSGRLTAGTGISTSISTNMSCLSSASDCHNISAKIGRNEHDLTLIVLSPDMQEAVNTFGRYVIFNVSTKQGPATSSSSPGSDPSASFCVSPQPSAKNAFDILMYRKKGLVLPGKFDIVRPNAYYSLFNDFVDLLDQMQLGFHPSNIEKGKYIVKCVTDAIWYLDPHLGKFEDRSCLFPPMFTRFRNRNKPGMLLGSYQ